MLQPRNRPVERGRHLEVDEILIFEVDEAPCIADRGQHAGPDIAFHHHPGNAAVRIERACDRDRGRRARGRVRPRRADDRSGNRLARATQAAFRPGIDPPPSDGDASA